MSDENFSASFKIIILDGVTYKEDNLEIPFSGVYNWVADDGADVEYVYESGTKISQKISRKGLLESKAIFRTDGSEEVFIYNSNGQVEIRNEIVNGKLEGLTEVFSDGILNMSAEFKNGKKNGESIVYNTDGSISTHNYYINDVKQNR